MPLPIWPEPITPTFLIIAAILSSHRGEARLPPLPFSCITPAGAFSSRKYSRSLIARLIAMFVMFAEHRARLLPELAKFLGQFRNRLVQVRDQAVIGDLKNRRVLILVDSDDHLGILHAGEMLNRPGNTDRNIELRRHHLAGLSDLPIIGRIPGIDGGPGGTDPGTELIGERLDVFGE